ncbi:hypothetical protein OG206_00560 [Streptomyces sp. NBC_01341]|uniref:hypothetical protein n=1 Tax=Streptomyces sp. NBC_01341 TaxID=2903831 RepID=UPI002E0E056A|nr:hypothetical protein OG206_00560 [Streptomyces sp. NBC_01341]
MQRYDTCAAPDPFASSMEAVKSLAARLSAPEAVELDHASMERLIESDGREILRRFFQDHLDLRALREGRDRHRRRSWARTTKCARTVKPDMPGS